MFIYRITRASFYAKDSCAFFRRMDPDLMGSGETSEKRRARSVKALFCVAVRVSVL